VQAALDHFAANEAREDAQAAEENAKADVVKLNDAGQDVGVVAQLKCGMCVDHHVNEDDEGGNEGEKINPGCFPGEEIAPQFNAREAIGLNTPQAPGLLREFFKQG